MDRTEALWKALKGIAAPSVILDQIMDLRAATTAVLGRPPFLTVHDYFSSGVRQGCVLAPALFCGAIDFLGIMSAPNVGIQVSKHFCTGIDYADEY